MKTRRRAARPVVEGIEGRHLLCGLGLRPPVGPGSAPAVSPWRAADPGDVSGVTDPRIIREGATYYLVSTGPGVPIRASHDLVHWQVVGQVFPGVPAWALAKVPGATSIWAPDISYFNGQYHLYYAVSTFGSQRSVIGLATNATLDPTSPAYHWVDRGEVIESTPGRTNFNAIDPNLVIDPRSGLWLTFGSQWSGVKIIPIDPATGKPKVFRGRPRSLAARPGGAPIEAPFVFQKNGFYYLFVSYDVCCRGSASTYRIMVGRSRSLLGPYDARGGRPMRFGGASPVLASDARYRGPGHNAVFSDNGRDWLVYHTYDALKGGTPTLQFRPLLWSPDGWPVVGPPLF